MSNLQNKLFCFTRQRDLLHLANSEAGRYLLGSLTDAKYVKDPITKISPNSYHLYKGKKNGMHMYEAHFFVRDDVMALFYDAITKIDILRESYIQDIVGRYDEAFLHYSGLKLQPGKFPEIYCADTFNSNTGGDGWLRSHNGGTWDEIRNAVDHLDPPGMSVNMDASTSPSYFCYAGESDRQYLYRGYFPFDTSALGDGITVQTTGTKLRLYVTAKDDADNMGVGLILTTQTDPTSLATADINNLTINTPTEGATRLDITAITTSAYNEWAANASLASWVSLTGYTKLGLRTSGDIDNSAPSNDVSNSISGNYSESASNKPELVVAYGTAYSETYTDVITIAEAISKSETRVLTDVPVIADSIAKSTTRIVSDTVTIAEAISKQVTKVLSDTVTIAENITRSVVKVVSDTVTIAESFVKNITRTLTDTISISEVISKVLNAVGRIPTYIRAMASPKPTGTAMNKDKPGVGVARAIDKPDKV